MSESSVITRVWKKRESEEGPREMVVCEGLSPTLLTLKMEEGAKDKECWSPLKAGKEKKARFSSRAFRKNTTLPAP